MQKCCQETYFPRKNTFEHLLCHYINKHTVNYFAGSKGLSCQLPYK